MKQWYCNKASLGYWPVGFLAVVNAERPEEACVLLNEQLEKMGLAPDAEADMFEEIPTSPGVHILVDGQY